MPIGNACDTFPLVDFVTAFTFLGLAKLIAFTSAAFTAATTALGEWIISRSENVMRVQNSDTAVTVSGRSCSIAPIH